MLLKSWLGARFTPYLVMALGVFFLVLVPIFWCIFFIGSDWRGVLPPMNDDQYVYYARMREVSLGLPWIGHPFYLEHANQPSSVFVGADWLASLPLLFGASLNGAVIFNSFFWSFAFVLANFTLFRNLKIKKWYAVVFSLLVFAIEYWSILRPVSYQVFFWVLPLFWLSCLWLIRGDTRIRVLFLMVASSTISFYLYPFLSLCIGLTMLVFYIFFIFKKNWKIVLFTTCAGLLTLILSSPVILYSFRSSSLPYYSQTLRRISLIETHAPSSIAVFAAVLVVIAFIVWLLLWKFNKEDESNRIDVSEISFNACVGSGLVLSAFFNVFTGKEMELGQHIVIFVHCWFVVALATGLAFISPNLRFNFKSLNNIIYFLVLLLLIGVGAERNWIFRKISEPGLSKDVQSYSGPLMWLNRNSEGSVIWTNDYLGYFIASYTKDYLLYSPHGKYFLMSDEEVRERYLISRSFKDMTQDQIMKDYWQFAGAGAQHRLNHKNLFNRVCTKFKLGKLGVNCGKVWSIEQEVGLDVLENMYQEYETIKNGTCSALKKYNVKYILKDSQEDMAMKPESLVCTKLEYSDGRFEIFSINF